MTITLFSTHPFISVCIAPFSLKMKLYSLVPGSGADHRAWLATSPLTVPRESVCTLLVRLRKKNGRKKEEQPWQSAGAGGDMRSTFWCVRWRRSLSEWSSWALTHPVVCGTAENDLLVCVNSKQKYARGVPQSLVNKKWRFTSHCCLGWKKKKDKMKALKCLRESGLQAI